MDEERDHFEHRLVPATETQAKKTGPASVFDHGVAAAAGPGDNADAVANDLTLKERARKTIAACGPISRGELMETLQCAYSTAGRLISELRDEGAVIVADKTGVTPRYVAAKAASDAPATGFKGWLARKANAAPAPAPKKGRKGASTQRAVATVPAQAPALTPVTLIAGVGGVPPAPAVDELRLGVFSDGQVTIAAGGVVLQLNAAQAQRAADWLQRMSVVAAIDARGI